MTSARHVLRRDLDSADEALATAEAVGRASMADLRATMDLLRAAGEPSGHAPLPGLAQLPALVSSYAERGLDVGLETGSDVVGTGMPEAGSAVGLTLYRIAQEALANAATHAPQARTRVRTAVGPGSISLEIVSEGPLRGGHPEPGPGRYGLLGMRERAEVIGADFHAGPSPDGWTVRCVVPTGGTS